MRFTQGLLPLLAKAAEAPAEGGKLPLARVISVLGAGHEGAINLDDFDLKKTYSLKACATHSQTGSTLAPHALWSSDPAGTKGVTWIHSAPGGVNSGLANKAPGPAKLALKALFPIAGFLLPNLMNDLKESGERHVWAATVNEFSREEEVAEDGIVLLGPKSDVIKSGVPIGSDTQRKLWEHTLDVFKKIEVDGKY
jgi:hypothetical protein